MRNKKLLLGLLFYVLIAVKLQAQSKITKESLPFDPEVITGQLENGMTYYIKYNAKPENRAELALVNKVGSIDEDDDQRGFAHFCEHMSFNGSRNFPKHKLIEYMESIGMAFGADVNAYTSFDETVYTLTVPLDKEEYIDNGLLVLHDWAAHADNFDEEIEKERGVIFEEKRSRLGVQMRMMDKMLPVLTGNSKYTHRMVIGEDEIILKGKPEALRRFRNDWYRPDLQAIVIVGDFDLKKMEEKIKNTFSKIPKRDNPRKKEKHVIPEHDDIRTLIFTDKEQQAQVLMHAYKIKDVTSKTKQDVKKSYEEGFFPFILNQRLSEKQRDINAPFFQAGGQMQGLFGGINMFSLFVVPKEGKLKESYAQLIEEVERLKRYGITESEFNQVKTAFAQQVENRYNNRENVKSKSLLEEYKNHFLKGSISLSAEDSYKISKEIIDQLSNDGVNKTIRNFLKDGNQIITLQAPEKDKDKLPTESELVAMHKEILKKDIANVTEEKIDRPLIEKMPVAGKVVKESFDDQLNITKWELQNGLKVVLKPTDYKKNEVLMSSFSWGGTSLYNEADLPSADFATDLITSSGVGGLNPNQLSKLLTGKTASARPSLASLSEGINGSCNPKDFETMMQLCWSYFTSPNKDKETYDRLISSIEENLKNKDANINGIYRDSLSAILSNYHPRSKAFTKETLKQIDFEKAYAIYKERFANASDFTFVFVGDFKTDEVKPMIELYLGSLPSTHTREKFTDHNINRPKGAVEKHFSLGKENKSNFYLSFNSKLNYTYKNRVLINATAQLLTESLLKSIREEKGGAYSLSASPSISKYPKVRSNMTISFPCDPMRVKEMKAGILTETEKIVQGNFKDESLNNVKEILMRRVELNKKTNAYWRGVILNAEQLGESPDQVLAYENIVKNITKKDIIKCAKEVLNTDQYTFVYTVPNE